MESGSNGSICGSCKHTVDCLYYKSGISRLFCEEFDIDIPSNSNIASGQKNCDEGNLDYGNLIGLCMNCDNIPVCVYSKPDYKKSYCLEYA